jgi:hypothetical protein
LIGSFFVALVGADKEEDLKKIAVLTPLFEICIKNEAKKDTDSIALCMEVRGALCHFVRKIRIQEKK